MTPPPVAWSTSACGQARLGGSTLQAAPAPDPTLASVGGRGPGVGAAPPPPPWEAIAASDSGDRGGQDIDTIVLHGTNGPAGQTGRDIVGFWNQTGDRASAHYIVDRDGRIVQAVPDERMAFHAGGANDRTTNARSIGIEFVSPLDGKTPPTEAQLEAGRQLVRYLAARYGVSDDGIRTHSQVGDPRGAGSHDDFGEDGTFDVPAFIATL